MDQVERWARHVAGYDWKAQLKPFLDSQVIMANRFYSRLARTPEGRRKLSLLGSRR